MLYTCPRQTTPCSQNPVLPHFMDAETELREIKKLAGADTAGKGLDFEPRALSRLPRMGTDGAEAKGAGQRSQCQHTSLDRQLRHRASCRRPICSPIESTCSISTRWRQGGRKEGQEGGARQTSVLTDKRKGKEARLQDQRKGEQLSGRLSESFREGPSGPDTRHRQFG